MSLDPAASPPPRLLVAILNWNTPDLTLRCLAALRQSVDCAWTPCIVDNGSTDASLSLFARLAPDIRVLALPDNRGFATGHAAAVDWARTSGMTLVCLLNSDAVPAPDALQKLVAAWTAHGEGVYAAVPWVWGARGERWANLPEKYLDPLARPRAWRRDRPLQITADWSVQPARVVAAAPGCCVMVPLSLVADWGGMGAEWFLYCEELDWSLRLRARGVRTFLVPAAQVLHAGGGSQRADPRLQAVVHYYRVRNEIVLARRHAGRWTAVQIAVKKGVRALLSAGKAPRTAWAGVCGVLDAWRGRLGRTWIPALPRAHVRQGLRLPLALERLLDRLHESTLRDGIRRQWAGASTLTTKRKPARLLRAFHDHVAKLLIEALRQQPAAISAQLGTLAAAAEPRVWKVDLQIEHTLVRPGGRDSDGALPGAVSLPGDAGGHYLVRLVEAERLAQQDLIVDYSLPNLEHLSRSGQFSALRRRMYAIAPLWYRTDLTREGRDLGCITQFADLRQPRRRQFLEDCLRQGVAVHNVRGIWRESALRRVYRRTALLVNVHQTEHHHTFEELRVLPALANGVIVLSEDVPLRSCVPYHEFIVWAELSELPQRIAEVRSDYAAWHQRLFGDGRLRVLLDELRITNQLRIHAALHGWLAQGTARPIPAS